MLQKSYRILASFEAITHAISEGVAVNMDDCWVSILTSDSVSYLLYSLLMLRPEDFLICPAWLPLTNPQYVGIQYFVAVPLALMVACIQLQIACSLLR